MCLDRCHRDRHSATRGPPVGRPCPSWLLREASGGPLRRTEGNNVPRERHVARKRPEGRYFLAGTCRSISFLADPGDAYRRGGQDSDQIDRQDCVYLLYGHIFVEASDVTQQSETILLASSSAGGRSLQPHAREDFVDHRGNWLARPWKASSTRRSSSEVRSKCPLNIETDGQNE